MKKIPINILNWKLITQTIEFCKQYFRKLIKKKHLVLKNKRTSITRWAVKTKRTILTKYKLQLTEWIELGVEINNIVFRF